MGGGTPTHFKSLFRKKVAGTPTPPWGRYMPYGSGAGLGHPLKDPYWDGPKIYRGFPCTLNGSLSFAEKGNT